MTAAEAFALEPAEVAATVAGPVPAAIGDTFAHAGEHARWGWRVVRGPIGPGGCFYLTRGGQDLLARGNVLLDPARWRRVRAL